MKPAPSKQWAAATCAPQVRIGRFLMLLGAAAAAWALMLLALWGAWSLLLDFLAWLT